MNEKETCLSCKVISVCCLFGIGGYFFKLGLTNKPRIVYNMIGTGKLRLLFIYTFSNNYLFTASAGLGVGQVFDYSPFRS